MAVLAEVGREISATLDTRAVLERIGERVHSLLNADTTALFLADADGRSFRAILAIGELADAVQGRRDHRGRGDRRQRDPDPDARVRQRRLRRPTGPSTSRAPTSTSRRSSG